MLCFIALKHFFLKNINLSNQDEDSEDEPKLKYERLANGVTEILQMDAASCMTVHDKVEVISLRSTHQQHIPHCLCTHLRGTLFKIVFSLIPRHSHSVHTPFFSHLLLLFLWREALLSFLHLFPLLYSFHFFFALFFCQRLIVFWERGTLGLMFNRCGTSGTNARLSRAEVTSGHVFSPDCFCFCFFKPILDFHLFISVFSFFSPL